jgi:hypothetical protein
MMQQQQQQHQQPQQQPPLQPLQSQGGGVSPGPGRMNRNSLLGVGGDRAGPRGSGGF